MKKRKRRFLVIISVLLALLLIYLYQSGFAFIKISNYTTANEMVVKHRVRIRCAFDSGPKDLVFIFNDKNSSQIVHDCTLPVDYRSGILTVDLNYNPSTRVMFVSYSFDNLINPNVSGNFSLTNIDVFSVSSGSFGKLIIGLLDFESDGISSGQLQVGIQMIKD